MIIIFVTILLLYIKCLHYTAMQAKFSHDSKQITHGRLQAERHRSNYYEKVSFIPVTINWCVFDKVFSIACYKCDNFDAWKCVFSCFSVCPRSNMWPRSASNFLAPCWIISEINHDLDRIISVYIMMYLYPRNAMINILKMHSSCYVCKKGVINWKAKQGVPCDCLRPWTSQFHVPNLINESWQ